MMFLIKYAKYITPVLAVILLVGAFWYHGATQYQKGVHDTKQANLAAKIKTDQVNVKETVNNEKKYKAMPISAIDAIGYERDWVRAITDR